MSKERKRIEELRRVMGTLPDQKPSRRDNVIRGVKGITVGLIDWPKNPYKAIFTLATSTWGKRIDKWPLTRPEHRFLVVKAALTGNTLPTALETPKFTFAIEGISRSSFDQTARGRIGFGYGARGVRDNSHADATLRIPEELWDDSELISEAIETFKRVKELYCKILDRGNQSWQSARCILPLGMVYGFSFTGHFKAIMEYCSKRMKLCEQEDTVATAWLMREAILGVFPFLANFLRPGCDYAGKCQYHKSYSMSELFGCLFKECGRNPCPDSNDYAEFNRSCSDQATIAEQLGIVIPGPSDWIDYTFETLEPPDRALFEEA